MNTYIITTIGIKIYEASQYAPLLIPSEKILLEESQEDIRIINEINIIRPNQAHNLKKILKN